MSDLAARVVIVEDESQIRRFVRKALEDEGCQVFEAPTCKQGLIEAGTRKPDLIVLDLGLPDRSGLEFITDLRGWSGSPILVLSARSNEDDKIDALDRGADDYLTKPFGIGELLVDELTRGKEAAARGSGSGSRTIDLSRTSASRPRC